VRLAIKSDVPLTALTMALCAAHARVADVNVSLVSKASTALIRAVRTIAVVMVTACVQPVIVIRVGDLMIVAHENASITAPIMAMRLRSSLGTVVRMASASAPTGSTVLIAPFSVHRGTSVLQNASDIV